MEIAHAYTGTFRVIAKILLVGFLIILLAKVILALLAVGLVGALIYLCVRALYTRRTRIRGFLSWIEEGLLSSVVVVFQTITIALAAAASWLARRIAQISLRSIQLTLITAKKSLGLLCWLLIAALGRSARLACVLLGRAATIGGAVTWRLVRHSGEVVVRLLRTASWAAMSAWVTVSNHARVIGGFLVETASGALVGAMLGFLFLPEVHPIGARVCGAAVLGAFLGITVGLSRITGPGRVS
jgi:hypothetical protein